MFFRNLSFYTLPLMFLRSMETMDGPLSEKPLRDPGPLEQCTVGFRHPYGSTDDRYTLRSADCELFQFGMMSRMLPASVVNRELGDRLRKISEEQGRRVGAKERKRMKDEVLTDLLPRAFVQPSVVSAYLDRTLGLVVVDTSSWRAAELVTGTVRDALGTFPIALLAPDESPRTLMTDWVMSGKLPVGFSLADEAALADPAERGAVIRCTRQDLETDEVRKHIATGKQVRALGLTFDDRVSFVLTEDLQARKFRLLDQVLDELANDEPDSAAAELESRFTLLALEVRRLVSALNGVFALGLPK